MIKKLNWLLAIVIIIALTTGLAGQAVAQPPGKVKVIVTFSEKPGRSKGQLVENLGGKVTNRFRIVPAMAATVPEEAIETLLASDDVIAVEADAPVWIAAETLPWGVDQIDAELVHPSNRGAGVRVAILDTGIDLDHPDLSVAGGRHFYGQGSYENNNYDDDNGHGTHIAGTVAALDNEIGVIGVAPGADLYSVKVLASDGIGYVSDLINGIEWAVDQNMDVINMSLTASGHSTALQEACDAAYEAGTVLVAATGNSGGTVAYPARYDSVIAVSATANEADDIWSSSGSGPAVELAAPGVSIDSTCLGSGYCPRTGTSSATAHVSGATALVIASGISDMNGNGQTNDEARVRLQQTAVDLGTAGRDDLYGYGRVDAYAATNPTGNLPPVADAGSDQSVPDRDGSGTESVTLDGSASYDYDGTVTSWEWTEGGIVLGTSETLTRSFSVGTHTVYLTVADNEGATGTDSVTITVRSIATATVSVPASAAWSCDTGVDITAGQILYITASGEWSSPPWTGDANGDPNAQTGQDYLLPGANAYSLIGRISDTGTAFFSGTDYEEQVSSSGRLYLGMNDAQDGFDDNTGELIVVVGLEDPPQSSSEPSQSGGGCFIATAACGSYFDEHVRTLRDFRDTRLASDSAGSGFVSLYYRISPPIASFVDDHPVIKPAVRAALLPSVAVSTAAVHTSMTLKAALAGLLVLASVAGLLLMRRSRRETAGFLEAQ